MPGAGVPAAGTAPCSGGCAGPLIDPATTGRWIVDKLPLVIVVLVVELPDCVFFARAGDADDGASTEHLAAQVIAGTGGWGLVGFVIAAIRLVLICIGTRRSLRGLPNRLLSNSSGHGADRSCPCYAGTRHQLNFPDMQQLEVFAGDRIFVAPAQEADVVGIFQVFHARGIASEFSYIFLYGARVLRATMDQFLFAIAFHLESNFRHGYRHGDDQHSHEQQ